MENVKAKDKLVEETKDIGIGEGDFVTFYDDSEVVDVYVVESLFEDDTAQIVGLSLTKEKDDVIIKRAIVDIDKLIYLNNSFVNVDGMLWNIRKKLFGSKIGCDTKVS